MVGVESGVSATTKPSFSAGSDAKTENCDNTLSATASNTTLYCFDQFDRLTRQRAGGATEQQHFSYDGLDRRDTRTDHVGATESTSSYKYIGNTSTISAENVTLGTSTT